MEAEALDEIDDERIEADLPDRPVTSVRDIEALYGRLYALGRGLFGAYGPFLSPDSASELVGQERLAVTFVDVTGETATLADDPVRVVGYAESLDGPTAEGLVPDVRRAAHAKYESARGVDHSITHISGQTNGPEKHTDHAVERFTRWPGEDAVRAEAEDHGDGWLINALAALGENEGAMGEVREVVQNATEEGQFIHTVALRIDSDAVETTDAFVPSATWHLPGEIEVLQEAMVRRKANKFRAKNDAEDASGDGVCYVDDTGEEVYGVVDDPLKWYLSKQRERFPRLDPDQAWRTQGLGREAAIAAQNATTFLDACAEPGPGVSALYLPYFEREIDAGDAEMLYATLVDQTNDDDQNPIAALYNKLQSHRDGATAGDLRFVFMIVQKYQKDRWRLLAFEPNAATHHGVELARSHRDVVNSPLFKNGPLPRRETFDLLGSYEGPLGWLDVVTSVYYFARTCAPPDTDDEPSSDDLRFRAAANAVGGDSIDSDALLGAYVDRIVERFDLDGEYPFPDATVSEQHAQLTALANAGRLQIRGAETDFTVDTSMTNDATAGGETLNRTDRLHEFMDRHDALSGGERRGVFALGALAGRISRYQRSEGRSMTAVKRHPIDKLTTHNVTDIATSVVDANVVYSGEEGYTGTMFAELMDEVVDGLLDSPPERWSVSTDDLRYHYAMGIAYGLNDRSTSDYEPNDE